MGVLQKDPLKALTFGLFSSQGKQPSTPKPPPPPPTPPDISGALAAKRAQGSGLALGGTFLTSGTGYSSSARTTGGKTLLGQ